MRPGPLKAGADCKLIRTFQIETSLRVEFRDVTRMLQAAAVEAGAGSGVCHLFVPHTTAALLINEHDDQSLQTDFDEFLRRLAPPGLEYNHNDGNCDAHLKAALIGCSKTLLVEEGRLVLGRWQGVYFCEFDGPRRRELRMKFIPD
ncbi:MAG: secondary thiamine-phosphate synthase enzyme YjbQ [Acidobacteriota bacterium]|nr:secondary thiamine-phosphate synthase enzyme YjbQ [Acidobacteriota bacterium]